jgi:DNA-binding NarL/FixJ family response regulator
MIITDLLFNLPSESDNYREVTIKMEISQTIKLPDFTQRELEVLHRIASGETRKQIAEELGVKYTTIDNYMRSIFRLLGLHHQVELVLWAQNHKYGKVEAVNG